MKLEPPAGSAEASRNEWTHRFATKSSRCIIWGMWFIHIRMLLAISSSKSRPAPVHARSLATCREVATESFEVKTSCISYHIYLAASKCLRGFGYSRTNVRHQLAYESTAYWRPGQTFAGHARTPIVGQSIQVYDSLELGCEPPPFRKYNNRWEWSYWNLNPISLISAKGQKSTHM